MQDDEKISRGVVAADAHVATTWDAREAGRLPLREVAVSSFVAAMAFAPIENIWDRMLHSAGLGGLGLF